MAVLSQFTAIDGEVVSPWATKISTDLNIGTATESFVQQADITLANPFGRFDNKGWNPNSVVMIVLMSREFYTRDQSSLYAQLIFTGKYQSDQKGVRGGSHPEVKIKAGCDLKKTCSAILWNPHKHHGQTVEPVLEAMEDMFDVVAGEMSIPPDKKKEWFFHGDLDGRSVLDLVTYWDGHDTFVSESNVLVHTPPIPTGVPSYLTGRMKEPETSENTMNYCNCVEVRGGSFRYSWERGASIPTTEPVSYCTNTADLQEIFSHTGIKESAVVHIAKYGTIKAPVLRFPDCTTKEECKTKAMRILTQYVSFMDTALPAVVGRSPELKTEIFYQTNTLDLDQMKWVPSDERSGMVRRRKDEFSSTNGWVSKIEVSPWVVTGDGASELFPGETAAKQSGPGFGPTVSVTAQVLPDWIPGWALGLNVTFSMDQKGIVTVLRGAFNVDIARLPAGVAEALTAAGQAAWGITVNPTNAR